MHFHAVATLVAVRGDVPNDNDDVDLTRTYVYSKVNEQYNERGYEK